MNYSVSIKIVEYLCHKRSDEYLTIKDLSRKIRENYLTTYRTVLELEKKGIISITLIARNKIVSINKTMEVYGFLTMAKSLSGKSPSQVHKEVIELYEAIP